MDSGIENKNLGLSREELELLVGNTNNPELLKKYNDKLENCDLSRSAIELINKEGDIEHPVPLGMTLLRKVPELRKLAVRAGFKLLFA